MLHEAVLFILIVYVIQDISTSLVKFQVPPKELYKGRVFQVHSTSEKTSALACAVHVEQTCSIHIRRALHYNKATKECECGEISGLGMTLSGSMVQDLPGTFVADLWSISSIDYSTYVPSTPMGHIPLTDGSFALNYFNGSSFYTPLTDGVQHNVLTFEGQKATDMGSFLMYFLHGATILNELSVLVWFRVEQFDLPHYIWSINDANVKENIDFTLTSSSTIEVDFQKKATLVFENVTLKEGTWNNIGYVFDKEGTSKLYLNGVLLQIIPYFGVGIPSSVTTSFLTLGKGVNYWCKCSLADFYIYTTALNDSTMRDVAMSSIF